MVREGVRAFGPTVLVTMMKCRLNGGGLCPRHESLDTPSFCVPRMAIVWSYSGLSGGEGGVGENELHHFISAVISNSSVSRGRISM